MELGLRLEVNTTDHILSSSDFLILFNTCRSTNERSGVSQMDAGALCVL